jgi:RNA polymerase sigma factor (TIGR02999 family)
MDAPERTRVTRILLESAAEHNACSTNDLAQVLYPELRRMAGRLMRTERAGHTLQPTALVSEAFLRLVDQSQTAWQHRAHFLGVAARVMRQVLVDHARARAADKRGAGVPCVTLGTDVVADVPATPIELLLLDDLLRGLATLDPRAAQVVELRVFGGLTVRETAEVLQVSARTVDGDWAMARMWLAREFGRTTSAARDISDA